MIYINKAHEDFFNKHKGEDVYRNALFYTLGICETTRNNLSAIYDASTQCIIPDAIGAGWQTGTSVKITRLAFNLFTDNTPTAYKYSKDGSKVRSDIKECARYSVSDIFAGEYAPYMMQAIMVRYPSSYPKAQIILSETVS